MREINKKFVIGVLQVWSMTKIYLEAKMNTKCISFLKNFKGRALFRKGVIIFEETVNCKFFKLDNTTSALGIISDKTTRAAPSLIFSANNTLSIGYYLLHKISMHSSRMRTDHWLTVSRRQPPGSLIHGDHSLPSSQGKAPCEQNATRLC